MTVEEAWAAWHDNDEDAPGCCNPLFSAAFALAHDGADPDDVWRRYRDRNGIRADIKKPPPAFVAGWRYGVESG